MVLLIGKRVNRKERAGKVRGHVGLWHEEYVVSEESYKAIRSE
ncbi:hypothetical protein SALBM311S_00595 [Streptomyces alboniger]